jgi:spore coat polysaccharide biosynthesis protein SpsF
MNKLKVVAIIQARMNSSRLPGKVLLPLNKKPVLWWMINRVSQAKLVDEIVIATYNDLSNIPIKNFSNDCKLPHTLFIYEGKENKVIERVRDAARETEADIIVDITADCPMVDPQHIDRMLEIILANPKIDYISNCIKRDWPDGLDIQVYYTDAIEDCIDIYHPQQHAGWNIPQHADKFNCIHWPAPPNMHWPDLGLTLDAQEDYKMLSWLFDNILMGCDFKIEDIIKILKESSSLITNQSVKRKTPKEG